MNAEAPSSANYLRIAKETEANLRDHVLAQWFPRAVDTTRGGFNENFGEDWTPGASQTRSLVYQSRLTWISAKAAERYPAERTKYIGFSRHGLAFLMDHMWDAARGGFYWSVEDATNPQAVKQVYGIAFAMYASAANYEATRDHAALELAKETFGWLESHAHDPANGGYFEALDRDGTPILGVGGPPTAKPFPRKSGTDAIGAAFGQKSMNTHIHLLEALTELYGVWRDPLVAKRLREVFQIVRDKVVDAGGYQHMFFSPAWQPAPGEDSYGHDIEAAYLLIEASTALGKPSDTRTWSVAQRLVDHTLKVGWDEVDGGVYDSGSAETGASSAREQRKVWWVQAEGLNSLLLMRERFGRKTNRYWEAFVKEWNFISRHQVDAVHMGWYGEVSREGVARPGAPKSDGWTEAYHQGRALMNVTDRLRRLAH